MSTMTLADYQNEVARLSNITTLSVQESVVKNHLLSKINQTIRFVTAMLKRETDPVVIAESKANLSAWQTLDQQLGTTERVSVTDMLSLSLALIKKNPNQFEQADFLVIDSLHGAFLTLATVFSRVDVSETLPKKDQFLTFQAHLKAMDKLYYELGCYSFWDPINGLVINRDRKRYTQQLTQFKALMQSLDKDIFNVWLCAPTNKNLRAQEA